MFDKLFDSIQIRGMELRNRVVMSAMGTHESAESEDGKSVTGKQSNVPGICMECQQF